MIVLSWVGRILGGLGLLLVALVLASMVYNRLASRRWLARPEAPGKLVDVGGHKLYVTVKGEGNPTVVVLTASGVLTPIRRQENLMSLLNNQFRKLL